MVKRDLFKRAVICTAIGCMVISSVGCGKKETPVETTAAVEDTASMDDTGYEDTYEDVEGEGEDEDAPKQEVKVQVNIAAPTEEETEAAEEEFVPVQSAEGRWRKGSDGWSFVLNSTNEIAKSTAIEIEGQIYYFDEEGYMANSGWTVEEDGTRRYVQNGEYMTGWVDGKYYVDAEKGQLQGICEIDGVKYILNEDGTVVNGWKELDGAKYYAKDGKMCLNMILDIDDATYGFDEEGKMVTDEFTLSGKKYLFNEDGTAKTGMVETDKGLVYCDDGEVQTGKVEVNGAVLKFNEDGSIDANKFVNGIFINADGTPDSTKRVTNIGGFADKDGIDKLMNGLPAKLVDEMFTQNGWKLIYDSKTVGSLEEIEGKGAVSASGKFLKFHNLDTVGHRIGHYINYQTNKASGIKDARKEEFEKLEWDEFFNKSDVEYFSEACGKILTGEFDKEKAPKTYEYIVNILKERYDFK